MTPPREALVNLKRSTPVSLNLCIICQEERRDILYDASEKGLGTLSKITHERQKLWDVKYKDTVDRLLKVLREDSKRRSICTKRAMINTLAMKDLVDLRMHPWKRVVPILLLTLHQHQGQQNPSLPAKIDVVARSPPIRNYAWSANRKRPSRS